MVKLTPVMGWNAWNWFGGNVSEQLLCEIADAMVSSGLADCGYEYIIVDDGWSLKTRDKKGRLVPDPAKFPNGIQAITDYIHGRGLKFGMYSCAGNLTCAGYPGSFEHEFVDADTFASWGVDYLKYDYCYHSKIIPGKYLYRRMGIALENCGRDILFHACSWGADQTHEWIKETAASMWRSGADIYDNWATVVSLAEHQAPLHPYNGVGCFNDMDMLIVGLEGKSPISLGGCSYTQYKTHFSLWAFFASPLIISCDIRRMSPETKNILTHRELIAINQDRACRQLVRLEGVMWTGADPLCYYKQLENGDIAIGLFNLRDETCTARFNLDELGLPYSTGKTLEMRELWTGERVRVENAAVSWTLEACGCAVFRCKVVDAG